MQDYKEIFNKRGGDYHKAMLICPLARKNEFEQIINIACISKGMKVIDCPSGGGYLRNYLKEDVELISIEFADSFNEKKEGNEILLSADGTIPIENNTADRVISLAGLHHKDDLNSFLDEIYRCLKPNGLFAVADVLAGSDVDRFLNYFVNENSSLGHDGKFLIPNNFSKQLQGAGFEIKSMNSIKYNWEFYSISQMVNFCRLLFGIDKAPETKIEDGIREYLGVTTQDGVFYMPWELLFVSAIK